MASTERCLWLRYYCIFSRMRNVLKKTLAVAWDPIASSSSSWIPCLSSCPSSLTRVSVYPHFLAICCDGVTRNIPLSFIENELRFCVRVLGFMAFFKALAAQRCATVPGGYYCFRSSYGETPFSFKAAPFRDS